MQLSGRLPTKTVWHLEGFARRLGFVSKGFLNSTATDPLMMNGSDGGSIGPPGGGNGGG